TGRGARVARPRLGGLRLRAGASGGKGRAHQAGAGRRARAGGARALSGSRATGAPGRRGAGLVLVEVGTPAEHLGCEASARGVGAAHGPSTARRRAPTRAPTFVRNSSTG